MRTGRFNMTRLFFYTVLLAALGFTSGCATSYIPPGQDAYEAVEYKLAPGDQVKVAVFGEDRFDNQYNVSTAGDLSFPLIGNIQATGLSETGLQAALEQALSEGYLNDPRVTVEVINYRPFFIMGEVQRPGKVEYSDGLTALQAVASAGGFSYRADQRKIYIRHVGEPGEKAYDLQKGRAIYVSPGDTIRIGERYF